MNTNQYGTNLAVVESDFNVVVESNTPITIVVDRVQNQPVTPSVVGNFAGAGDP